MLLTYANLNDYKGPCTDQIEAPGISLCVGKDSSSNLPRFEEQLGGTPFTQLDQRNIEVQIAFQDV